jgi:hypothetical protein
MHLTLRSRIFSRLLNKENGNRNWKQKPAAEQALTALRAYFRIIDADFCQQSQLFEEESQNMIPQTANG